jgi:hypothetical protein
MKWRRSYSCLMILNTENIIYRMIQERFMYRSEAIHGHLHKVLEALNLMAICHCSI